VFNEDDVGETFVTFTSAGGLGGGVPIPVTACLLSALVGTILRNSSTASAKTCPSFKPTSSLTSSASSPNSLPVIVFCFLANDA
jgi:hypothetical protein